MMITTENVADIEKVLAKEESLLSMLTYMQVIRYRKFGPLSHFVLDIMKSMNIKTEETYKKILTITLHLEEQAMKIWRSIRELIGNS